MKSPETIWQRNLTASMSRFKSFFRFRISLTFKLILAMFFLVLLTSASFGWFIIAREMAYDQVQMEVQGTLLAKSFAHLLQYTIGLSDRATLQLVAERIIEDEAVVQCILFNPEGKTWAYASKNLTGYHPTYLIKHPLLSKEGERVGTLRTRVLSFKNQRADRRGEEGHSSGHLGGSGDRNLIHPDLYPAPHPPHRKAGRSDGEGGQRGIGFKGLISGPGMRSETWPMPSIR